MDEPMVVSILSLTWNREASVRDVYPHNINLCGLPRENIELLVADQGSTDGVNSVIAGMNPAYHRLNKNNEGIGRALNQLLLRAKGDFICLMGSDIKQKPGWLRELLLYALAVPNAGIVGIKCTAEIPPLSTKPDITGGACHAHYLTPKCDKVFGTQFFSRKVLQTVGGFHEGFHPYGFEDSDFNNRINNAGFTSLYVPEHWVSEHVHNDVGENSDYRRMKDASLAANGDLFWRRHDMYLKKTLPIYEPLPPECEPNETPTVLPVGKLTQEQVDQARKTPMGAGEVL